MITAVAPPTLVTPRLDLQSHKEVPPNKKDPDTSLLFELSSLTKPTTTETKDQDGLSQAHKEMGNTIEVTPIQEKGRVKKMVDEIEKVASNALFPNLLLFMSL